MMLLTKLILAHLIGDFLLQPLSWVKAKEKSKLKASPLFLHALLHGILIMLLVWDWTFLPWAALLTFVHLAIDATKLLLQKKETETIYFFADQLLHFLSIYLIVWWYFRICSRKPGFCQSTQPAVVNPGSIHNLALFFNYKDDYCQVVTSH